MIRKAGKRIRPTKKRPPKAGWGADSALILSDYPRSRTPRAYLAQWDGKNRNGYSYFENTMRTKATSQDLLSKGEIIRFLECHIPYRLEFLRRGRAIATDSRVRDPALVEAALMAGRQLIQFLGLTIKPKDQPPSLRPAKGYRCFDDRCYEVKIVNLGGEFLEVADLEPKEKRILEEFIYAADKSSAHLTEDSGHKLWQNDGEVFFGGCEIIHQRVSAACAMAKERLARST